VHEHHSYKLGSVAVKSPRPLHDLILSLADNTLASKDNSPSFFFEQYCLPCTTFGFSTPQGNLSPPALDNHLAPALGGRFMGHIYELAPQ
jgi:hypothetical protein